VDDWKVAEVDCKKIRNIHWDRFSGGVTAPTPQYFIHANIWFDQVMRELDNISKDFAKEFQAEINEIWNKGTYKQNFYQAPPMRLLSLALPLISWLGWILHEKHDHA
jgi:hypothetical protein